MYQNISEMHKYVYIVTTLWLCMQHTVSARSQAHTYRNNV